MKDRSTALTFWIPRGSPADKRSRSASPLQSRAKVAGPFWTLVGKGTNTGRGRKKKKITKSYLNQWSIERRFDIDRGYLCSFSKEISPVSGGVSRGYKDREGSRTRRRLIPTIHPSTRVCWLTDSSCLPDTQAKPTSTPVCIRQPPTPSRDRYTSLVPRLLWIESRWKRIGKQGNSDLMAVSRCIHTLHKLYG